VLHKLLQLFVISLFSVTIFATVSDLEVFDMAGRKFSSFANCNGGRKFIDAVRWLTGVYLVFSLLMVIGIVGKL
jgi:hypothetical protein